MKMLRMEKLGNGGKEYSGTLHFPLDFSVNHKLLKKESFLITKTKPR